MLKNSNNYNNSNSNNNNNNNDNDNNNNNNIVLFTQGSHFSSDSCSPSGPCMMLLLPPSSLLKGNF